ncbi:MAG: ABC transporter substrate-binding protein [Bacteriovoracaceae bacterium]|nr:ABC transporter substrate-binding protein [Bacteriovoracaceae bacterium]
MKIICLTEESVEILYLLKREKFIEGVSAFVKRPAAAMKLPKVSYFTSSNLDKIVSYSPDMVLGFSDIQKDIAKDLIERGQDVWIANHRSIDGILKYIKKLGFLVDAKEETLNLLEELKDKIDKAKIVASDLSYKPKVYFEEWDDPMIGNIQWVSELIELCGGIDINKEKSRGILAKERFLTSEEIIRKNPDIIFGCHCGKKVKVEKIKQRPGWENINAIKNGQVFELEPEIFLQPGPAPLVDGIIILQEYFKSWQKYSV